MKIINNAVSKWSRWLLLLGWIPTFILLAYWVAQPDSVSAAATRTPIMVSRIYTGADGQTHVEEYELPLTPQRDGSSTELAEILAVESIQFRRTSPDYFIDWHNAPRRQYVITLRGASEVAFGDGTKLRLYPCHILLAEDTTGHGQSPRALGAEDRL